MYMVRVILRVIELYQKSLPLDAVIVRFTLLLTSGPGKADSALLFGGEAIHAGLRNMGWHRDKVAQDQLVQGSPLRFVKV